MVISGAWRDRQRGDGSDTSRPVPARQAACEGADRLRCGARVEVCREVAEVIGAADVISGPAWRSVARRNKQSAHKRSNYRSSGLLQASNASSACRSPISARASRIRSLASSRLPGSKRSASMSASSKNACMRFISPHDEITASNSASHSFRTRTWRARSASSACRRRSASQASCRISACRSPSWTSLAISTAASPSSATIPAA